MRTRPGSTSRACEAVQLFAERAAAAQPGFALTPANADLVLQVCRRLDGLPLALELAAARLSSMSLPQLAERLNDRFRLLDSATRAADPRHRSLSASVTWSYELLEEPERALLARLAVFPAAFTLKAAEQVASGAGLEVRDIGTLLGGLVTRSMVHLENADEGQTHYRLLEITREYGKQRLGAGALAQLHQRHAQCYLDIAEQAEPHLPRAGSAPWLARLHHERHNFRAALQWSFTPEGNPQLGARLVRCLWYLWDLRGTREEGLHWVHAALHAIGTHQLSRLHRDRNDLTAAMALALRALEHAREVGEAMAYGLALDVLASLEHRRGDLRSARQLIQQALDQYQLVGYLEGETSALHLAGHLALASQDPDTAQQAFERSLHLCRRIGHRGGTAIALEGLAAVAAATDNDEGAVLLLGSAAALRQQIGTLPPATVQSQHQQAKDRLTDKLGHLAAEQTLNRGAALPIDELIPRSRTRLSTT